MAEPLTTTAGVELALRIPAIRFFVLMMRESRIRFFCSLVQRPEAIDSPARCTTASTPLSASAGGGPDSGDQARTWLAGRPPAVAGERDSATTECPSAASDRHNGRPINPVAPVTSTLM